MSIVSENEYYGDEAKFRKKIEKMIPKIEYAVVVSISVDGRPVIQFDGESHPSNKPYRYYDSYIPRIGQRVQLIDNIIQGGWTP